MKTIFTKNIDLGKDKEGENVRLSAPSWDCGWYWGFGYIGNRDSHYHFNGLWESNLYDNIKNHFNDFPLKNKDLWTFCELMNTFYTLKETAEVLWRGGSNMSTNPLKDLIINKEEVKRINEEILPRVFDEIYKLFKS